MRLISFDPFRTLGLPPSRYIKPELMLQHLDEIRQADWVLFPEYWQINTLAYVLKARIFPSLGTYHLGHDKIEMTRAFQAACPTHVPRTEILGNNAENRMRILDTWRFPFVAKKVRSSMGLGVSLIETREEFERYCADNDTLYIQEVLPIQRDLRIVLAGRKVVHWYWREGDDFLNNVSRGARIRTDLPLPDHVIEFVETLSGYLDINYAGFDVALVDDHPYLLEFNRLFGNQQRPQLFNLVSQAVKEYLFGQPDPPPRLDQQHA